MRHLHSFLGVSSVLGLVAVGMVGCGSDEGTSAAGSGGVTSEGGAAGSGSVSIGGSAGTTGETMTPPDCDASAADDPDGEYLDTNCDGIDGNKSGAVFVSPLGSDDDPGTMEKPVTTITKAVQLAAAAGKDVYVCSATYEENVVIDGVGVRVFGGYACEDGWGRTSKKAEIAPAAGVPLYIHAASAPVLLSNLSFVASDAVTPGESSIAARIVDSPKVNMDHSELIAGAGAPGAPGAPAEMFTTAAPSGRDGVDAHQGTCYASDGTTVLSACKTVVQPWTCSSCGNACTIDGGSTITVNRLFGGAGGNRFSNPNVEPSPGRTLATQTTPAPGTQSNAGKDGAVGAASESGFGEVSLDGQYMASNAGTIGKYGRIGVHGPGGAGGPNYVLNGDFEYPQQGGSGGSGGLPGCGGRPGNGGGGGGASIALLAVNSGVELERVLVRTAAGGDGGDPSDGAAGQKGGTPGLGGKTQSGSRTAKSGTAGGNGGKGGAGGPGGGGPSVGIVAYGIEVVAKAMTFDIGPGGEGGTQIAGSNVGDGADGLSEDVHFIEAAPAP